MDKRIIVALDAMGGDYAPVETVKGAVDAVKELKVDIKLVGPEDVVKAELAKYKEAFFADGGTEEEWADRTMSLFIDYDVKYFEDDILSLQVTTAKSWVSAEEEHYFYNIDLKKDTELTLADVLGENYVEICNKSITDQINARLAADENAAFFGFGDDDGFAEGFTTVDDSTPFYLNAEGNVVTSFPEYSIAPGSMGIQEFVIS